MVVGEKSGGENMKEHVVYRRLLMVFDGGFFFSTLNRKVLKNRPLYWLAFEEGEIRKW